MRYTVKYQSIPEWRIAYDDIRDYIKAIKLAAKFAKRYRISAAVFKQGKPEIEAYIKPPEEEK